MNTKVVNQEKIEKRRKQNLEAQRRWLNRHPEEARLQRKIYRVEKNLTFYEEE